MNKIESLDDDEYAGTDTHNLPHFLNQTPSQDKSKEYQGAMHRLMNKAQRDSSELVAKQYNDSSISLGERLR